MKKVQFILKLVLAWLLLIGAAQSSFAGKTRITEPSLSSLSHTAQILHNSFTSIHSRRFEHQAINIGWGKRGKKIIQMRIGVGICRENDLPVPNLTINNPVPKDPNYFLLRFSCFSHRGPPAKVSLT